MEQFNECENTKKQKSESVDFCFSIAVFYLLKLNSIAATFSST